MPCCCKYICNGCDYANIKREIDAGLEKRCAFCREPRPKSEGEIRKRMIKRIEESNDPLAMYQVGGVHYNEGDYKTSLGYFTKAAGLGDAGAHHALSIMYDKGQCVEKDGEKSVYHLGETSSSAVKSTV